MPYITSIHLRIFHEDEIPEEANPQEAIDQADWFSETWDTLTFDEGGYQILKSHALEMEELIDDFKTTP